MKIKEGFILREIVNSWVVVPIGERVVEFNGLITLSESSVLLWKILEAGADLDTMVTAILDEYDVDEATARTDVQEFITALNEKDVLE